MTKGKLVIFIAGEGGHYSQYKRLSAKLLERIIESDKLLVTDCVTVKSNKDDMKCLCVGYLRPKSGFSFLVAYQHIMKIYEFYLFCMQYENITVISTGPGISLLPSFIVKLMGGKVIHLETWSRFYSKSFTGRFMYYLSDLFLVQNKTLLELYPKAKYSGRL